MTARPQINQEVADEKQQIKFAWPKVVHSAKFDLTKITIGIT